MIDRQGSGLSDVHGWNPRVGSPRDRVRLNAVIYERMVMHRDPVHGDRRSMHRAQAMFRQAMPRHVPIAEVANGHIGKGAPAQAKIKPDTHATAVPGEADSATVAAARRQWGPAAITIGVAPGDP